MREEWFVTAKRNDTEVELAAPEDEGMIFSAAAQESRLSFIG